MALAYKHNIICLLLQQFSPEVGESSRLRLTELYVLKVFEGTWLERVAKSYQAAQEKAADEHVAHSKCSTAFAVILSLEKEAEEGAANGILDIINTSYYLGGWNISLRIPLVI